MNNKPVLKPDDIPFRFGAAWNIYGAQGIADLFYEDADFINVTGKWWDNKTDIFKAHDFGFRVIFPESHFEVIKVKVKMIADDIAVIHARIRVSGQSKKEVEHAGDRDTMFLFVAKKEQDQWLCISAQNTDITGEQTNIRDESGELKSVSYKEKTEKITHDLNED